jgi:RNA polymerase sigma-70 factor (ECF subfamily)
MSRKIYFANLFPITLVLKNRKREPERVNEEQVLVERARNGEMGAFRELVERYKKKIYYLSLDLTGNHHDAEDLSQEVFIKAYRSLKNFRGDAKLNSWLYRITVNTCISQRRKKSVSVMTLQEDFDGESSPQYQLSEGGVNHNPELSAEAGLMQQHIDKALQRLTPRERSIFVLRHYNDLPLKEIAQILKITEGTVKSMLFRAIKKLQKQLSFYREDFIGNKGNKVIR